MYTMIHSNLTINEEVLSFILNISYIISIFGHPFTKSIPIFYKVVMSQFQNDLLTKLRGMIQAFPNMLIIIMIIIKETFHYNVSKCHSMT